MCKHVLAILWSSTQVLDIEDRGGKKKMPGAYLACGNQTFEAKLLFDSWMSALSSFPLVT